MKIDPYWKKMASIGMKVYFAIFRGNSYGVLRTGIDLCPQINLGVMHRILLTE
ncbi:MAG: hypothetical protein GX587_13165 [Bacteroidales bacterium]|nr:hypothetical protein [Bacteroidales bacterium]